MDASMPLRRDEASVGGKGRRAQRGGPVHRRAGLSAACPLLVALALALSLANAACAGRRLELTLLHTNDIHGHMLPYDYGDRMDVGGAARRATLIDRIKRETRHPVLVIDSGDTTTRGPLWTEHRGKL